MSNNGKEYELFVSKLQQAILNTEGIAHQKNISVEVRKIITDNCGIDREFDVYWEYELGGIVYKTVIECKDYCSKISVDKIDALLGKVKDLPDLKPVFATKIGYQSGAQLKADQNKVSLLIVREQNDSDWTDAQGNPLIKVINMNLIALTPPRIVDFRPTVDKLWLNDHPEINLEATPISANSNEIFIDNIKTGERYSIHDLGGRLASAHQEGYGKFTSMEEFENAFLCHADLKLKLKKYEVDYVLSQPIKTSFTCDFGDELIGVIEYLDRGLKKSIFKNGMVKDS